MNTKSGSAVTFPVAIPLFTHASDVSVQETKYCPQGAEAFSNGKACDTQAANGSS